MAVPAQMETYAGAIAPKLDGIEGVLRALALQNAELTRRVDALTREVRRLKSVTPAQAKELGVALRARAEALCLKHGAAGCEARVVTAIRRDVRRTYGITNARELAQADFMPALAMIGAWDDWKTMKGMVRNGQR